MIARKATLHDVTYLCAMGYTFKTFPMESEIIEWILDARHTVVVLEDEGKIVGFAIGIRQSTTWLMLESFWVNPNWRNDGGGC